MAHSELPVLRRLGRGAKVFWFLTLLPAMDVDLAQHPTDAA